MTRDARNSLLKSFSDGFNDISATGVMQIHCDFNPEFFPFDQQICTIRVESSRYEAEFQTLHVDFLMLDGFIPNDQWKIELGDHRDKLENFTVGSYSVVEFDIKLERKVCPFFF